jgi:hypothetical protein
MFIHYNQIIIYEKNLFSFFTRESEINENDLKDELQLFLLCWSAILINLDNKTAIITSLAAVQYFCKA